MLQKPTLTILNADCIAALKTLPDNSVHCVVTSPPYYGLRNYKVEGQIGLEETPQQYVDKMVEVFREVRRVLREDGVCWLNLGDSYVSKPYKADNPHSFQTASSGDQVQQAPNGLLANRQSRLKEAGIKVTDLLMIPARVALALQADGWYLRGSYPWIKRNGMPESVKSRPSQTIESIFMLTKSSRYFYDAEAVKKPLAASSVPRLKQDIANQVGTERANGGAKTNGNFKAVVDIVSGRTRRSSDWFFESWQGMLQDEEGDPVAFVVNTKPYRGAHFATFPMDLVRPMILASTSERGCCAECGAPLERVVVKGPPCPEPEHRHPEKRLEPGQAGNASAGNMGFRASKLSGKEMGEWKAAHPDETVDWQPTCDHPSPTTIPCTVLDPFGGSGTTAQVALELGCNAIVRELNAEYIPLIHQRCDPILTKLNENP
jgi:DNA modification methylase